MDGIRKSVKSDGRLRRAEISNFGNPVDDIMKRVPAMASYQPWEGRDGPCGYGEEVDKIYWEDMPIDSEIIESHNNWVNNRRQWSGTSKYLQESIEPTVDWIDRFADGNKAMAVSLAEVLARWADASAKQ